MCFQEFTDFVSQLQEDIPDAIMSKNVISTRVRFSTATELRVGKLRFEYDKHVYRNEK
jgi:hypothetical protein